MTIRTKGESHLDPLLPECHRATTLRYQNEVTDPSHFAEIKDLPEAGEEELALMTKIVDKMTTDLDRIEALISESLRVALHPL